MVVVWWWGSVEGHVFMCSRVEARDQTSGVVPLIPSLTVLELTKLAWVASQKSSKELPISACL